MFPLVMDMYHIFISQHQMLILRCSY